MMIFSKSLRIKNSNSILKFVIINRIIQQQQKTFFRIGFKACFVGIGWGWGSK